MSTKLTPLAVPFCLTPSQWARLAIVAEHRALESKYDAENNPADKVREFTANEWKTITDEIHRASDSIRRWNELLAKHSPKADSQAAGH